MATCPDCKGIKATWDHQMPGSHQMSGATNNCYTCGGSGYVRGYEPSVPSTYSRTTSSTPMSADEYAALFMGLAYLITIFWKCTIVLWKCTIIFVGAILPRPRQIISWAALLTLSGLSVLLYAVSPIVLMMARLLITPIDAQITDSQIAMFCNSYLPCRVLFVQPILDKDFFGISTTSFLSWVNPILFFSGISAAVTAFVVVIGFKKFTVLKSPFLLPLLAGLYCAICVALLMPLTPGQKFLGLTKDRLRHYTEEPLKPIDLTPNNLAGMTWRSVNPEIVPHVLHPEGVLSIEQHRGHAYIHTKAGEIPKQGMYQFVLEMERSPFPIRIGQDPKMELTFTGRGVKSSTGTLLVPVVTYCSYEECRLQISNGFYSFSLPWTNPKVLRILTPKNAKNYVSS